MTDKKNQFTPSQPKGPFYPIVEQSDKDCDLTTFRDNLTDEEDIQIAEGEVIFIEGCVTDPEGEPIINAKVDIWQANSAGRYAHEADSNPNPLDKNFQGWAIARTDGKGRYCFKTIRPGSYPARVDWERPPHIHFEVSVSGFTKLVTQMYFENELLNDKDPYIQNLSEDQKSALIIKKNSESETYIFNIKLAEV